MRLICIMNAHTPSKRALTERSARRVGIEVVLYKEGTAWPNELRIGKLVHALECVKSLPEDVTHVMFVDSWDSLFLAGPEEIIEKYELMHSAVMVQGEKNCYPDKTLESQYPAARTPWHFVNSGGWIAHRAAAEEALDTIAQQGFKCDQQCWSHAYLKQTAGWPITIDENCQIFQSMFAQTLSDFALKDGRLENLVTGGRPCVLHWNGTRNEGRPFSRDGVYAEIDPESMLEKKVPTIAVCMPGNSFSNHWVFGFANLYLEMVKYFGEVRLVNSYGNNIYQVRENCVKMCALNENGAPDFVLWLDSDNPPAPINFAQLWAAIQGNQIVSAVGGWYRFCNEETKEVIIAAGRMNSDYANITEEEILAAEHLIQVPFIGFGMCLMRWRMIADVGVDKAFAPYYFPGVDPTKHRTWATDDSGFFAQASLKGHKTFLHPAVFLEHEKQMNVPASFTARNEQISVLKEN